MKKILVNFIFYSYVSLSASDLLVLVIADDYNSSVGHLSAYSKNDKNYYNKENLSFSVNIGKLGLALGVEENVFKPSIKKKQEGDKKAPLGIFKLGNIYTKNDKIKNSTHIDKDLICVDDSNSKYYNKVLKKLDSDNPQSFENMLRDDNLYDLVVEVEYNKHQIKNAGSCIFLHIQRGVSSGTMGCTSMAKDDLLDLLRLINKSNKSTLVQITSNECSEVKKQFDGIECF